ncbi:MAG: hypothetical protein OXN84_12345 [Albidovulum sp.]|nr:hypothetical protein [Albidovulum sp.]
MPAFGAVCLIWEKLGHEAGIGAPGSRRIRGTAMSRVSAEAVDRFAPMLIAAFPQNVFYKRPIVCPAVSGFLLLDAAIPEIREFLRDLRVGLAAASQPVGKLARPALGLVEKSSHFVFPPNRIAGGIARQGPTINPPDLARSQCFAKLASRLREERAEGF